MHDGIFRLGLTALLEVPRHAECKSSITVPEVCLEQFPGSDRGFPPLHLARDACHMGQRKDRKGMTVAILLLSQDTVIGVAGAEPSVVSGVQEMLDQKASARLEGLSIGWVPAQLIADTELVDQPGL